MRFDEAAPRMRRDGNDALWAERKEDAEHIRQQAAASGDHKPKRIGAESPSPHRCRHKTSESSGLIAARSYHDDFGPPSNCSRVIMKLRPMNIGTSIALYQNGKAIR